MEVRPLTQPEQKYTYSQSMQLEGQTGCIGHLRGDFAPSGYGFYTTWFDTREQWKSDEFKAELDEVINTLREDKGLLHNRYDMSAFARANPDAAFTGNYCTEYGFRVDTDKHAFLLRCNPTKGDYNFYCYCYVKEWLDGHIQKAEQGIIIMRSSASQTAAKSLSIMRGEKKRKRPAVSLTSTIPRLATISTTSANLPSVWSRTDTAMSQSPKSRPRKPRSIKTMNDKEDFQYGSKPESRQGLE